MLHSIRARMMAWIALPTLLIYILVAVASLVFLIRVEYSDARTRMTRQAASYASQFNLLLREAATVADTSARLFEIEPHPTEEQGAREPRHSWAERAREGHGSIVSYRAGIPRRFDAFGWI